MGWREVSARPTAIGEFHTVVTAAPQFDRPIEVKMGQVVERDGFVFADIIPT